MKNTPVSPNLINSGALSTTSQFNQRGGDTAKFSMGKLHHLVEGFKGAQILDKRGPTGGRLWVEDSSQSRFLAGELEKLGFVWANSRESWYYKGD